MQHKKKICNICNLPKRIFSKGSCLECSKIRSNKTSTKKHRPLRKIADKQKNTLQEYSKLRKKYLQEHILCEAKLVCCSRKAVEIHHKKGRGIYTNDVSTFIAICRNCHEWVHLHSNEARKKGLLY